MRAAPPGKASAPPSRRHQQLAGLHALALIETPSTGNRWSFGTYGANQPALADRRAPAGRPRPSTGQSINSAPSRVPRRSRGPGAGARQAVWERLSREIEHWDARAAELAAQAAQGRQPRINPARARARAEELDARRAARLAQLDAEARLQALPPVVTGAALVVPAGWLARRPGEPGVVADAQAHQTAEVERLDVDAVLAAERALGRVPTEQAHNQPGYDVASLGPDGHLSFIEVKGRIAGGRAFSVTRTEILCGLNSADRYVLALVEVAEDHTTALRYLRRPFDGIDRRHLHFAETATTFDWSAMWSAASPST